LLAELEGCELTAGLLVLAAELVAAVALEPAVDNAGGCDGSGASLPVPLPEVDDELLVAVVLLTAVLPLEAVDVLVEAVVLPVAVPKPVDVLAVLSAFESPPLPSMLGCGETTGGTAASSSAQLASDTAAKPDTQQANSAERSSGAQAARRVCALWDEEGAKKRRIWGVLGARRIYPALGEGQTRRCTLTHILEIVPVP
jgi:hypothetical protein